MTTGQCGRLVDTGSRFVTSERDQNLPGQVPLGIPAIADGCQKAFKTFQQPVFLGRLTTEMSWAIACGGAGLLT